VQHQGGLLLLRLDRDEPHRWPRHRLTDRRRIIRIVLAAFEVGCRFGGACLLFPLPDASPPGVNVPSLSNLHAERRALSGPYLSRFDSGLAVLGSSDIAVSGSCGFVSRARRDSRIASCLCILSESSMRNSGYFFSSLNSRLSVRFVGSFASAAAISGIDLIVSSRTLFVRRPVPCWSARQL
jgi:hypothetical protein